ncbi:MAG TPA: DedA family protein [Longimicrobiaceae bacterium]|nr:DedA family protein [Longimicrobiaceae bacterium]
MGSLLDWLLQRMLAFPEQVIYLVVGTFALVENVFPPVPADVVALFGGFLAGHGAANAWGVFLVVWISNVAGALFVYWVGRAYGARFFATHWGGYLLRPHQVRKLDAFYRQRGTVVIFVSRFLPMFRAVVPAFAGMSRIGWVRAALPIAIASALWYGLVVYLGATAGRNWDAIRQGLESAGRWVYVVALLLLAVVARWWWKSRHDAGGEAAGEWEEAP